jgi:hypothetical protein
MEGIVTVSNIARRAGPEETATLAGKRMKDCKQLAEIRLLNELSKLQTEGLATAPTRRQQCALPRANLREHAA